MFLALVIAAAVEAPPGPSVQLTRTGAAGAPVNAGPRSLSDVAREMRDGRRATGGFSAVESTVPRVAIDPRLLYVEEEERRREEPEVPPEPEPAGYVSNEIYGWGGGGWGPPPRRRPPHVSHHRPNVAGPRRERGGGVERPPVRAVGAVSSYGSRVLPLEKRSSRVP